MILEKSPFLEISDTETWISAVQMYKRIVSEFEIDYSASNRPVLLATCDLNYNNKRSSFSNKHDTYQHCVCSVTVV